ncbi:hypothetical protein A0H81_03892 [Grifola frondosa]|uniref:Uncharacterized protein n=1 Tax=Grifola frondosa TaxID=5627 RepID=A0A1C7MIJ3_GRIFR|nr:hypothetical protein A0H81_03892 [Grifola frondosa]
MEAKLPWLKSDEGLQFEEDLWRTLSTTSVFTLIEDESTPVWNYTAPPPTVPPLSSPRSPSSKTHSHHARARKPLPAHLPSALGPHRLHCNTDVRAPDRVPRARVGLSVPLSPAEDEVRREIRALKGSY